MNVRPCYVQGTYLILLMTHYILFYFASIVNTMLRLDRIIALFQHLSDIFCKKIRCSYQILLYKFIFVNMNIYLSLSGFLCNWIQSSVSIRLSPVSFNICIKSKIHLDMCEAKLPGLSISCTGIRQIP